MKAYKLFRKKKNGKLGSLFIKRSQDIELGTWYASELNPTKGFAVRQGWHCCKEPKTPHLKMELKSGEVRVWAEVEVEDYNIFQRPQSQGGDWILADKMKVIKILKEKL